MDAKSRKVAYVGGGLVLGMGILWGTSKLCQSVGPGSPASVPTAEVPIGVTNAGLLSRIVNPVSQTYSGAASEIEGVVKHSGVRDADPRLHELGKQRCELLREWSKYGTERGSAGANPNVPVELLDREVAFWRTARDLAAEWKPEWTAAADEVIQRIERGIAERKAAR